LIDGAKEKSAMPSAASKPQATRWLAENGPVELERLFCAIVYHPSAPILIADNERHCRAASSGAGKLLGLVRERIVGRSLDDFVEPSFKPQISGLWQTFLKRGEQQGTLRLVVSDGSQREVEYTAKGNVLPVRHLLILRDKTSRTDTEGQAEAAASEVPARFQDYALFLLNVDGDIVSWYSGAERAYGYAGAEAIGQNVGFLYPAEENLSFRLQDELKRPADEGYFVYEGWCMRKDGARFWGNIITMALKDENGELRGCESGARL
jgi:PAS domain S-box-containing protein